MTTKPVTHGRDHRPGGADPIPELGAGGTGPPGPAGESGERWFTGSGAPETTLTFPAWQVTQVSTGSAADVPFNADLPDNPDIGELLLVVAFEPNANNVGLNVPAGWTHIGEIVQNAAITAFAKQAAGDETTIPLVTWNGTARTVYVWAARYGVSAHPSTLPQLAGAAGYDPPLLDPTAWGTEKTQWIAASVSTNAQAGTDPAGYTAIHTFGTNSARLCYRNLEAASENPATFAGSFDGEAATIAVRPRVTAGAFGNVGDWYLDVSNGDLWEKTAAPTTWTLRGNLRGPAGPTGSSTFVSGTGPPTAGVGVDGAIYLDTVSRKFYGPKAAGAWPATALGRLLIPGNTYTDVMAAYDNYAALLAG